MLKKIGRFLSSMPFAIALLVPGGEAGTTHLKLLSKVAVLLMDDAFRSAVLAAAAADAIADAVNKGLAE